MATLSQNITQAISDFESIKTAIQNKGVSVPSGTPTSQYASKISSIQTGITPSGKITITQNGTDIDVSQYALADVNVSSSGGSDATVASLIDGNLTSITIPNGVTAIRDYAFYCTRITSVVFPARLRYINDHAFESQAIASLNFPSQLESIGSEAFANNGAVTTVDLTNTSIEYLSWGCFRNCNHLTTVYLPNSLTGIDEEVFADSALTDIYYTGTQAEWSDIEPWDLPSGVTVHCDYVPV